MDDVLADLRDYRDKVAGRDPLHVWADVAEANLPGVIFWTVDRHDFVKLSVGQGFDLTDGLDAGDAEGTSIHEWTDLSIRLVETAREVGSVSRIARESQGPSAGRTYLTCGVLHHSGDVVLMTVDLSVVEREGLPLLCVGCPANSGG